MTGNLTVNGAPVRVDFGPEETLLDVLRSAGFTEVKRGCEQGECGACLVLLDDLLVNSCQVFAATAVGGRVTTTAGLTGEPGCPHPIHEAYAATGAVQCGFCTPGMVMATFALLSGNPDPSDDEIREALAGNLCRCTGYVKIVEAVHLAAGRMRDDG